MSYSSGQPNKLLDKLYKALLLAQTKTDVEAKIEGCTHIIEHHVNPDANELLKQAHRRNIEIWEGVRFGWELILENLNEAGAGLWDNYDFYECFYKISEEFYLPYRAYDSPQFDSFYLFIVGIEKWERETFPFIGSNELNEANKQRLENEWFNKI